MGLLDIGNFLQAPDFRLVLSMVALLDQSGRVCSTLWETETAASSLLSLFFLRVLVFVMIDVLVFFWYLYGVVVGGDGGGGVVDGNCIGALLTAIVSVLC